MIQNPYFEIKDRKIGIDFQPVVFAELGINHGGSLDLAKLMVDAAFEAGVEIIKHQTHIVEDEMTKEARKIVPGHTKESIYEIMKQCALGEADEYALKQYVESKNMIFISTPFSRAAANRLREMNIPAYKIGSGECNNYPLIKHIASFKKPVILSTGMNSIESIKPSVKILRDNKVPFALLHCTNIYPTPPNLIRLNAIRQLKEEFPDAVLGLSDHSLTIYPALASIVLGASILERHFTDTKDRIGPDIECSMDKFECRQLIEASKIVFMARDGQKGPVSEEKSTIDFAFACVVTIKAIKKGDIYTTENIWVKRPGNGEIKAANYDSILGRTASKDIDIDEQLKWNEIN